MGKSAPTLAAVILAGRSVLPDDPLAAHTRGGPKGLIPIAGRPMMAYVLEALAGSRCVQRLVVVGAYPEDAGRVSAPVDVVPAEGDLLTNAEAGVRRALALPSPVEGVLICGSDLPLLTPTIVDGFVQACLKTDHDVYYGVIERSVMEARFPASRRTYVRLAEGEFAGGDLLLLRASAATVDSDIWHRLVSARKSPIRQAWMLGGPWPLVRLLTRRMTLSEAQERASRALRVRGRVIICPHAEVAMDVDKPFQLEIVRAELEARSHVDV
jgi:molybdopterin-guanine dinucleotide biosynthesis protein A